MDILRVLEGKTPAYPVNPIVGKKTV